eukprot:Tbor_TRINITY_DN6021_c3_g3::TRINITY_DN6021_c3_g3_i1::g.11144::m.11144
MFGNKRAREGEENIAKNGDFWDNSSSLDSQKPTQQYTDYSYIMPPVLSMAFGPHYIPSEHLDEINNMPDYKYVYDEDKSKKADMDYNEYDGDGIGGPHFPYDPRGQYDGLNDVGFWSTDDNGKLDIPHVTTSLFWGPDYYVTNQISVPSDCKKKEATDVPGSHFSWLRAVLLGALQRKDVFNRGLFYNVCASKGSTSSTKLPTPWRTKLNEMDAIVLDADAVRVSSTIKEHEMDAWIQEGEKPSNSYEKNVAGWSSKETSSSVSTKQSASDANTTKKNTSKFMKFLKGETAKFSGTDVSIATVSSVTSPSVPAKALSNTAQKLFVSKSATTPVSFSSHGKAAAVRLEDDEDDDPEQEIVNEPQDRKEEIRRAPRRGEIGITPETIAEAEKAGYKVGGSANARRHQEAYKAKLLEQQANKDGLGNLEVMDKKKEDDTIEQLFDMLY